MKFLRLYKNFFTAAAFAMLQNSSFAQLCDSVKANARNLYFDEWATCYEFYIDLTAQKQKDTVYFELKDSCRYRFPPFDFYRDGIVPVVEIYKVVDGINVNDSLCFLISTFDPLSGKYEKNLAYDTKSNGGKYAAIVYFSKEIKQPRCYALGVAGVSGNCRCRQKYRFNSH